MYLNDELFSHYSEKTLSDFKRHNRENPQIFKKFQQLAYKMKDSGREYYSSKMIINVLRWETDLRSEGEDFKVNDKFQSLYGRLLAFLDPEFKDFFRFRKRNPGS